jgi:two-component system response regulator LytT
MHRLTCVVVEDEAPIADELIYLLEKYEFLNIIGTAQNGDDAFKIIKSSKPDIIFLDINIPGMNGVELANLIRENEIPAAIIFVTAYENYALKAFDIEALDYLLKPLDEKRLDNTINRIRTHFNLDEKKLNYIDYKISKIVERLDKDEKKILKLPCEYYGKTIFIPIGEICYCYTENEKTYVKLKDKKYTTIYSLGELEEKTSLIRVHRSFVINKDNIKEFYSLFNNTHKVVMNDADNTEISVSRSKIKELKAMLGL